MKPAPRVRLLLVGPPCLCAGEVPRRVEALARAFAPAGPLADRRPDLVIVPGDLAATGAVAEYDTCEAALRQIAQATQVPLGRMLVVPGNHDVDRSRVSRRFVLDVPDAAAAEEFFAEREDVAVALRRFQPYTRFHARVFNRQVDADRPIVTRRLTIAGVSVGLLGLNSAWLAHQDGAEGQLVVGRQPTVDALDELDAQGRPDVVVAVVHHPPAAWADFERNALGQVLLDRCDLVIHGPGEAGAPRHVAVPRLDEAVCWVDVYPEAVEVTRLDARRRWAASPPLRIALPRALPTVAAPPAVAAAGVRPRDLEGYLRHVEDEWGHVVLSGLLQGRAQAAVNVRDIYISLRTMNPEVSGAVERGPVERLRQRLLAAPAEPDASDREAVRAALCAVGVPATSLGPAAVEHTWTRLLRHPQRGDLEALVRGLQTLDLDLALAKGRTVLVEGDPGTGKTTTLQHVAVALVDAWRGLPETATAMGFSHPFPLPVFVPMRRFWTWLTRRSEAFAAGGPALLLDYLRATLVQHAGDDAWLEPALEAGRIALLLDGLDEIPAPLDRERAARCIRDFVHRYQGCWFGVTSRPAGLGATERHALARAGLQTVRVQPLEPDQVRGFVNAWYDALIPDVRKARDKAHALLARIGNNPLTTTPVTLIAIAIVHHTLGDLPERRADLYEHCVQALCGRWDDSKEEAGRLLSGGLSRSAKVRLLQRMAHEIHQRGARRQVLEPGPALDIIRAAYPADTRPTWEDAHDILERLAARSGLLVPDGHRGWRFRHLTFQEYLTARHICAEREDAASGLAARLDDATWREVILLAVGYKAKDAAVEGRKLIAWLAEAAEQRTAPAARARAFSVVAQALIDLDGYHVGHLDAVMSTVAPQLVEALADPAQPGDAEARVWMGEALGHFGDPRLGFDAAHLCHVPAGPFTAGDPSGHAPEAPLVTVTLDAFWVARYPVTRGQYAAFIDAGGYETPAYWAAGGPPQRGLARYRAQLDRQVNHPVTEVDWYEACAFCAWLNDAAPRPDGSVWRLPTAAEWEKAARGGHQLPEGPNPDPQRAYPWGAWRPDAANWWRLRAREATTPVGCFPAGAGPYGTLDQAGNVDEWCLDRDAETPGRAQRGGYFLAEPTVMQVWWPSSGEPGWHSDGVGFRVVAGPPA